MLEYSSKMLLTYVDKCPKESLNVYFSFDIKKTLEEGNIKVKPGEIYVTQQGKVVFYGIDRDKLFFSVKSIAKSIAKNGVCKHKACFILNDITDLNHKLMLLQIISKNIYRFQKYKTPHSESGTFFIKDRLIMKPHIEDIIHQIHVANTNRDFSNEPANIIYPETFVTHTKNLIGNSDRIKIDVMDEDKLKREGFNLIIEMGKASIRKPRFMVIELKPRVAKKEYKCICLIGKGVTFDSGSINLKTGKNKELFKMKSDKLGATTVVSLIKYFEENSDINIHIIGLIPLIENGISGNVVYPGNIITSYGGKTVEILNTDAEGRLILAEALEYSSKFKNIDYIFDIATLTGDAEYFHCDTSAVIMTLDPKLKNIIEILSEKIGERVYMMPPWPEYMQSIESNVADVKNIDSNCEKSGTFMASMFLLYFVPIPLRKKWVHFDVTHSYTNHLSNGNCTFLILNLIKLLAI